MVLIKFLLIKINYMYKKFTIYFRYIDGEEFFNDSLIFYFNDIKIYTARDFWFWIKENEKEIYLSLDLDVPFDCIKYVIPHARNLGIDLYEK